MDDHHEQNPIRNNILQLYNIYPMSYMGIGDMIAHLPEVQKMRFNAVWINPFHTTSQIIVQRPDKEKWGKMDVKGSIYGIKDHTLISGHFITGKESDALLADNPKVIKLFRSFTDTAIQLGLVPICDLVLNHVAVDSQLVMDHPNWFYPENMGDPRIYQADDIMTFNYENEAILNEIFTTHWTPYITQLINDYGFLGVRADAARFIHPNLQRQVYELINHLCLHPTIQGRTSQKPIIFAEILYDNEHTNDIAERLKQLGITHITNSIYWVRSDSTARQHAKPLWKNNDFLGRMGTLRQIALDPDNILSGGTIGFAGSHDEDTLCGAAISSLLLAEARTHFMGYRGLDKKKLTQETYKYKQLLINPDNAVTLTTNINDWQNKLSLIMKAKLAMAAFTSDAGWYLMCGDEFGDPLRKSVFDFYHPPALRDQQWGGRYNLINFIIQINELLPKLPKPELNFWVEHAVLDNHPDLMVIIRHNAPGFAQTDVILINLTDNPVNISEVDIENIAQISQQLSMGKDQVAYDCITEAVTQEHLHTVGKVDLSALDKISAPQKMI